MARKKAAKPKTSKTAIAPRRSLDQLAIPIGYGELLDEIKGRIRSAQIKAVLAVNSELLVLYWSIGRDIVQRQHREGWGAKVIDRLAADLRSEFPEMSGLSRTNVYRMRAFYLAYESDGEIVPQAAGQLRRAKRQSSSTEILAQPARELNSPIWPPAVAKIPWFHNVTDLKMRSSEPEHAGQMSFYLSAVDELLRDPVVDQPTLGLILCRDKNRLIAEYALRDIHKPIGVAGWETKLVESLPKGLRGSLPTIEELEAELSREPAPVQPPKRRRRTDA
ncbi:MAG: PDDEXK nuclease domain-containing protein [Planctomycetota bacterium]|nr:PDDEXK nuclease domain-containing protein [Planctomycetota bacterium]